MKKRPMRFLAGVALMLAPLAAFAGMTDSPLAHSIPDDVHLMVHKVETPEDDFIQENFSHIWTALQDSGVPKDLAELVLSGAFKTPDARAAADAQIAAAMDKLKAVDWKSLASKEFIFAERFPGNGAMLQGPPEMVWLMSGDEDKASANFAALKGILDHLAGLKPGILIVVPEESSADEFITGTIAGQRWLFMAREKGVIAIGMQPGLMTEVLGSLDGKATKEPLVESAEFKRAFEGLPEPEIAYTFSELGGIMGAIHSTVDAALEMQLANAQTDEQRAGGEAVRKGMSVLFRELGAMDIAAETISIDGMRVITEKKLLLTPESKDLLFGKFLPADGGMKDWYKSIPADAASFRVNKAGDPSAIYHALRDTFVEAVPNGTDMLAQFDGQMATVGMSLDEDLFSWLTFDSVTYSLPAVFPQSPVSVTMMRVKDEGKARAALDRLLAKIDEAMQAQGGPGLTRIPATSAGEGFEVITHQQVAMFLRPVIGIKDGYLYIATGESGIAKSMEVAAGKAPSILESERFKAQGIAPDGPVTKLSYTDLSGVGGQIAQALGMMGFAGMMVQGQPDVPPEVGEAFAIIQKLAPVAAQVDFLDSSASETSVKDGVVRTTSYLTYKSSASAAAAEKATPASASTTEATPEAESKRTRPKVR